MKLDYRPDVTGYLTGKGVAVELRRHRVTYTATAEARALRMPPGDVLKTVVLRTSAGFAIAVIPASSRVDLPTIARYTGDRGTRLATEIEMGTKFPGFEVGAIPPLPGLIRVPAYVDPRVFDHDKVAFTDGRHAEALLADPRELFWGENCYVYPICVEDTWFFEGDALPIFDLA